MPLTLVGTAAFVARNLAVAQKAESLFALLKTKQSLDAAEASRLGFKPLNLDADPLYLTTYGARTMDEYWRVSTLYSTYLKRVSAKPAPVLSEPIMSDEMARAHEQCIDENGCGLYC